MCGATVDGNGELVCVARCENGYLRIFVKGRADETDRGHEMCGNRTSRGALTTTNPRLLMVFNSTGHTAGKGFSAYYQFITGQSSA